MEHSYLVYKHYCLENGKIYVGITSNLVVRIGHKGNRYLRSTPYFANAVRKYGWDSFRTEILETNLTKNEAYEREKHWIKTLNATDPEIGYNISEGGTGGIMYVDHPRGTKGKKLSYDNSKSIEILKANRSNGYKRKIIKVEYPDGQVVHFESMKKTCDALDISTPFLRKRIAEGTPYKLHHNKLDERIRYGGCVFSCVETIIGGGNP